jgi:primosomal protein N' (replication factor Y) (superfamily II helicase)
MTIARIALPVATDQLFDFWIPEGSPVERGTLVRARLAHRSLAGVVVEIGGDSGVARERLQPIEEIVALPRLPEDIMALAQFVATYYLQPLGMALALAVPPFGEGEHAARVALQALALTAQGRASLPALLARAPAAQRLFARLRDAPNGLTETEIAALAPHLRRTLRAWHAAGYAATPQSAAVRAVPVSRNDEQRAATDVIERAMGAYAPVLLQGVTGSG